jgi:hypothetical protein
MSVLPLGRIKLEVATELGEGAAADLWDKAPVL